MKDIINGPNGDLVVIGIAVLFGMLIIRDEVPCFKYGDFELSFRKKQDK